MKRLPLALFLSFLVLLAWARIFAPDPPPEPPVTGLPPVDVAHTPKDSTEPQVNEPAAIAADAERTLELFVGVPGEPGYYRAVFSNRGARLCSLEFGDYFRRVGLTEEEKADHSNWMALLEPIATRGGELGSLLWETGLSSEGLSDEPLGEVLWVMEELKAPESGVRFTYSPPGGGVVFEKRIRFPEYTWNIDVQLGLQNKTAGQEGPRTFLFTPAGCVPPEMDDRFYLEPQGFVLGWDRSDDEYEIDFVRAPGLSKSGVLDNVPMPVLGVGVHNKYFAFVMRDADTETSATIGGARYEPVVEVETEREMVLLEIPLSLRLPAQGESRTWDYVIYAGPKEDEAFVGDYDAHRRVLDADLRMKFLFDFTFIANGLLFVLRLFHGLVGNWGVAIILLTLCVRVALFPLNRRSQTAMARYQTKMKRVTPKMEEIKKLHADDPQKQREAQARLMQEEGAFPPLGGCLPIFFQMPIFIGLFSALRTSSDLRHQPFALWIDDLSRPDELMYLGWDVPIIGLEYLNLLPILMVVLWILQQRGMPQPTDEQQARMQKMMMFMPIMFGFLLYNYAAGLSLYMITSSGLGIFEQKVIKKVWPVDSTEAAPKKAGGCGPFSGLLQNLAEKQKEQMKRMQAAKDEQRRKQARQKYRRKR
ncbi:MAG: hypothetical protein CMJ89_06315 [Planctomycetes bacterium]|nr:hypothetical protein [Planctomycetota bacterium]